MEILSHFDDGKAENSVAALHPVSGRPNDLAARSDGASSPAKRSSAERLHRILSSFDYEHMTLTLSDLSRRAGLPLSTTHRMVNDLLDLGLLERDEHECLSIGIKVWKIGLLTPKIHGIWRVALPFMQDLYATTSLPVRLVIQHGDETAIVEHLRPRGRERMRPKIGERHPLHISAAGMALLAFREAEVQEEYVAKRKDDMDPEMIRRELAQTRARGYAVKAELSAPMVAIGAPILDADGLPIGSLSIVVPDRTGLAPYGHLLRSTARAVQRTAMESRVYSGAL